jgi:predicted transcriptional regulator
MRGEKKVEFRRRLWKSDVGTVVVYATEPEKQIVGYFTVSFLDLDSPTQLWRRHGDVGAIGRGEYRTYYAGATSGAAVGVGTAPSPWDTASARSRACGDRPRASRISTTGRFRGCANSIDGETDCLREPATLQSGGGDMGRRTS